jgi:hypothetical protein
VSNYIQRELSLWADFNSLDDQQRIKASLRFADSPERPRRGEWVSLHDDEGNAVKGVVEDVHGMIVHVRPEIATWASELSLGAAFAENFTARFVPSR